MATVGCDWPGSAPLPSELSPQVLDRASMVVEEHLKRVRHGSQVQLIDS
jgi:hypothetical protein